MTELGLELWLDPLLAAGVIGTLFSGVVAIVEFFFDVTGSDDA